MNHRRPPRLSPACLLIGGLLLGICGLGAQDATSEASPLGTKLLQANEPADLDEVLATLDDHLARQPPGAHDRAALEKLQRCRKVAAAWQDYLGYFQQENYLKARESLEVAMDELVNVPDFAPRSAAFRHLERVSSAQEIARQRGLAASAARRDPNSPPDPELVAAINRIQTTEDLKELITKLGPPGSSENAATEKIRGELEGYVAALERAKHGDPVTALNRHLPSASDTSPVTASLRDQVVLEVLGEYFPSPYRPLKNERFLTDYLSRIEHAAAKAGDLANLQRILIAQEIYTVTDFQRLNESSAKLRSVQRLQAARNLVGNDNWASALSYSYAIASARHESIRELAARELELLEARNSDWDLTLSPFEREFHARVDQALKDVDAELPRQEPPKEEQQEGSFKPLPPPKKKKDPEPYLMPAQPENHETTDSD